MSDITTLMMGAAGAGGDYQISRSLRFNSADSAYLSRTPASAGNRRTWTWSGWVKRSGFSASTIGLFGAGTSGSNYCYFGFLSGNTLNFQNNESGGIQIDATTAMVFRDVSAWYHIVLAVDTTQATNSNGVKLYVNGAQQTLTFSAYTQNTDTLINNNNAHAFGDYLVGGGLYFPGYLADIHFVDGQALTPSSFGEVDSVTGVWKPIRYAGTYGTNGFHLDFSDNSSTTALGYDAAGSNNWTPNNFSVTAGAGNDSLVDTPTQYGDDTGAGGEVRGNYATLNSIFTQITLTNGNLDFSNGAGNRSSYSTIGVSSGKWYCEAVFTSQTSTSALGVALATSATTANFIGGFSGSYSWDANGNKYVNGTGTPYGSTRNVNDVIGCALDIDAGTVTFYLNGVSQGVAASGLVAGTYFFGIGSQNSAGNINFGQRPFAYTAPSGFKALCTTNLPDPTVVQGGDYFNTVLYTGTGSSLGVTGVGFQPDFVWIKERSGAADHGLYDAVRGVQNQLESNTTTAETAEATGLTAFGTDGFTVGALAQLNTSADTYVAWNWKANGAGSSNTDGTITSTVSANTTAGISIVTFTGNGTSGATVGHGLGVAPKMFILKERSPNTNDWVVYNEVIGNTKGMFLNLTNGQGGNSAGFWNNTSPTSTVFSLGNSVETNRNSSAYVAYCFAEVEGFSKFGSYTGNGSTDGPFIFTGFRPAFVMVKRTDSTGSWIIHDASRDIYNPTSKDLYANLSDAETVISGTDRYDFLSNGFKLRVTTSNVNASGGTYIYAAFAENPFKNALAR